MQETRLRTRKLEYMKNQHLDTGPGESLLSIDTINGVKFTQREVEIIGCLLSWRTAKRIASFLSISPKTVENHLHNIMQKLGCNSRESIIDIIEGSEGIVALKEYASRLLLRLSFEQKLRDIAKTVERNPVTCAIIYEADNKLSESFLQQLAQDLHQAGVSISVEPQEKTMTLTSLIADRGEAPEDCTLSVVPSCLIQDLSSVKGLKGFQKPLHNNTGILFLLRNKASNVQELVAFPGRDPQDLEEAKAYYLSCLDLLKGMVPLLNVDDMKASLNKTLGSKRDSSERLGPQTAHGESESSVLSAWRLLNNRSWRLIFGVGALVFIALTTGFISFKRGHNQSICSNLTTLTQSALLDRPELLVEIDKKLHEQEGLQTVALVGIRGAGKKTLARQYARKHPATIVWEMNGETKEALLNSFESLAYVLAKSTEDKQILKEIQSVKNPEEHAERIVLFAREKLKTYPNWLLIYYHVTDVASIQRYFPQADGWEAGKVVVTTTDDNIQNNSHINHIIRVGDLNEDQRLSLFLKILKKDDARQVTQAKLKEIKGFLNKIPPFPLDVSIAAYYIKETKTSYESYLNYLHSHNHAFDQLQKNVLKEIHGADETTRHNIIALSLKQLINTHVDYSDLLLFISLIGSKYVPRDLLYAYKEKIVVDSFIHDLKKYSLSIFTYYDLDQVVPTFSTHSAIQANMLDYMTKSLNLSENKLPIQAISLALEKHATDVIEAEDFPRMRLALEHSKKLLTHTHLLANDIKGRIGVKVGTIYHALGNHKASKQWLEESIGNLSQSSEKQEAFLAYGLAYLGDVYRSIGAYEKAQETLEKSLSLYKEYLPDDESGLILALQHLGHIYNSTGKYEKAKEKLEVALVIAEKHFADAPLKHAHILSSLGNTYRELGHLEKAKALLEEGQNIYQQHLSSAHIDLSQNQVYLGQVYRELGCWEKAQGLFETGLEHYQKTFGEDNVKICSVLKYLGNASRDLGDFEKAKSLMEKSLRIYRANFSENHIEIAHSQAYLGTIYKDLGDYTTAMDLLRKGYAIYEKHYGGDHIETARILRDMGRVYYLQGDMVKGQELTQKALDIFEKREHLEIYTVYENLAELALKKSTQAADQNDTKHAEIFKMEAEAYLKQAIEIVQDHLSKSSPLIARLQNKLDHLKAA